MSALKSPMKITKLDHVNIQTSQLSKMVAWYSDILGMHTGKRPNFPFNGAWMYVGDTVMIHFIEVADHKVLIGKQTGNLQLEHFAFSATGANRFEKKAQQMGIHYQRINLSDIGLIQFHICDPDGNHIHLDFMNDE